jgi:hypothetical protein
MIRCWENAWEEFVPFLEFPVELTRIVYTTNAIESLNASFRRAVRHRGHFPNEQAAMKGPLPRRHYRRRNRENLTGRIRNWKQALNILTIHYGDSHAIARHPQPTNAIYTEKLTAHTHPTTQTKGGGARHQPKHHAPPHNP